MTFSDSHCHLVRYDPGLLTGVLAQARALGVNVIVSVGMTVETSAETISLAESNDGVLAAVGIHPWEAAPLTDQLSRDLSELVQREHVVAIGEVGLDYARAPETKEIQRELLIYELSLARETGLPVNIHCREAHQDMMDILHETIGSDLDGIIHGFSGDRAQLWDWLDLGFYISIGVRGLVINDLPSLNEVVREIPSDRLLTETDATGGSQPAGPADVISVATKLASLRGVTVEEIGSTTTENLKRLLRL